MKLATGMCAAALVLSFAAGAALGAEADKGKKQAEIRKAAETTLERFYKARPDLKAEVDKSPGYAVFTTFGLSFIVGGAGGHGLVRNRKTGANTYMNMAQASAGVQVGASQSETLIIFKSPQALSQFVDKGWEFGGGGGFEAGAGGKSVAMPHASGGENVIADAFYYTLTKNGVTAGGAFAGTKFWKDKDLN